MKWRTALILTAMAVAMAGCQSSSQPDEPTQKTAEETTTAVEKIEETSAAADHPKDSSEDRLLSTPVIPEVLAKGIQTDVDMVTKLAYTWGYPLVRMERVMREYTDISGGISATSYRAPLNQIGWARELATAESLDMPTANNDTLYLSAVVDLKEPYVFSVPDTNEKYYVVNVFNMWHELEHYIGQRTTGTKAGSFVIVPPRWEGEIPSEAGTVLQASTTKVWLWGRLEVEEGDRMEDLHELQDRFDLRPLSALGNDSYQAKEASLSPLPDIKDNPLGFLVHLGAVLKENPVPDDEKALFGQMSRIGLTEDGFNEEGLTEAVRSQIVKSLEEAVTIPVGSIAAGGEVVNGWTCLYELDHFGYNYPNRAMISGPYLGGNGMEEAFYPIRYADSSGDPLSGKNTYKMVFEKEPPVEAFWSITAYDAETKLLIDNPIDRYKIGSSSTLEKKEDGSFELIFSHEQPENSANWLPVGEGEFYLILRMYIPDVGAIKSHQYMIPDLELVK